jgi:uncharacterized membrane protein (DUF2068 family)
MLLTRGTEALQVSNPEDPGPAGAHPPRGARAGATTRPGSSDASGGATQSRLLPVLAGERGLRAVVLIGIGLILLTHLHTDWADTARRLIDRAGLDPSGNETGKLISSLTTVGPRQAARDGVVALAYGALEAVEGVGLWRRRTWAEYLTILSTALLLIPEVQELAKRPTDLKIIGLVLNVVIVAYLIARLVRSRRRDRDTARG